MKMQDYVRYSATKLKENFDNRNELVGPITRIFKNGNYQSFTLIASGSSYNSLLMVKDALQELSRLPVYLYTPEHVEECNCALWSNTFVIIVSQSGSSTNIISCQKYLLKRKISFVSLTGNIHSPMADYSTNIFDYGVGNEYVDYVTMGVQTLVEYFLLFANNISTLSESRKSAFGEQLLKAIEDQPGLLKTTEEFLKQNHFALAMNNPTFFCGNGPNFGVAKEGALKFQETLKRPAMYYELEEFLHGPDIQLTPNYTVFLIDDMVQKKHVRFHEVFTALKEVTPNAFLITSSSQIEQDRRVVKTSAVNNWILSLYYSLPVIQLVAAKMADELNTWPPHSYFDRFDKKIAIKTANYDQELIEIKQKWQLENHNKTN